MLLVKPDTMSFFPVVTRLGQDGHGCVLSVYACFSISQEDEHALREESQMWQMLPEALGRGAVFDEGFAKPRAEFLVYGSCHPPPDDAERKGMEVRVSVGNVIKKLQIFGERHFDGKRPMPPRPLKPFPIDWPYTYGGPECEENPLGLGHGTLTRDDTMPQILAIQDHEDDLRHAHPAGLRALPPNWPQRTRHLGPFDETWLLNDWPELPASSSKEFYCTAPEDQRLSGYLSGVEHLEIEGMHPSRPRLESSLPGLRARMFVRRRDSSELEEVQAGADTLWLLPELELGVLCWRGVVPVADDEAQELDAFVAGWEPLTQTPLPVQGYEDKLRREEADEADEEQKQDLAPSEASQEDTTGGTPETASTPAGADAASTDETEPAGDVDPLARLTQGFEAAAQEHLDRMGVSAREVEALLAKKDSESALPEDFDIQGFVRNLENETSRMLAEKGLAAQDVERLLQQTQSPLPDVDLQAWYARLEASDITPEMRQGIQQGREARTEFLNVMQELEQKLPDAESPSPAPDAGDEQQDASARQPVAAPMPSDAEKPEAGEDPPPPHLDFRNKTLHKATFARADLNGADFSGADVSYTDFRGAQLRGATFANAICHGADFEACIAHQADFSNADLKFTHFPHADLSQANLSGADMRHSDFSFALLQAATLHMVKGVEIFAPHVDCTQADARGADFSQAVFSEADFSFARLRGAVFRESLLDKASFYGASAKGVLMRGAFLHGSRADADTDFTKADFRLTDCCHARWEGAVFTQANFWGARLQSASLEKVSLHGCVLKAIDAQHACFDKADLQNANLRHANLFRASLRKARLQNARIQHTNLFAAALFGAHTADAVLENSNIKRTLLDSERFHDTK